MRTRYIFVLSTVAGTLGASATTSTSGFVVVFCFFFWAAIVAAVLLLARAGRPSGPEELPSPDIAVIDPWVDADGVRHFPGDVFDRDNYPRKGAHSHL